MPYSQDENEKPFNSLVDLAVQQITSTIDYCLDEAQLAKLHRNVSLTVQRSELLRRVQLTNSDEPLFVIRADEPEG